jgi:hypothetical protein
MPTDVCGDGPTLTAVGSVWVCVTGGDGARGAGMSASGGAGLEVEVDVEAVTNGSGENPGRSALLSSRTPGAARVLRLPSSTPLDRSALDSASESVEGSTTRCKLFAVS